MAHQWPDEMPPRAAPLLAAVAWPGGPDGASGPVALSRGSELRCARWRGGLGQVQAASGADAGRSRRSNGACGAPAGSEWPNRAAASTAVDPVSGISQGSTAAASGPRVMWAPKTVSCGPVTGAVRAAAGACATIASGEAAGTALEPGAGGVSCIGLEA